VGITKEEQILQRQAKVLELAAQGLTQHEIAVVSKREKDRWSILNHL
jgi:transcriptional regulator